MPREKIAERWRHQACVLKQNKPKMSAEEITRNLHLAGAEVSERTVSRWLKELKDAEPAEQIQYQYVSWPSSMGGPDLPWEASRAVLDLLRWRKDLKLPPPMTVEAKWFWRITLAAPALERIVRSYAALMMALHELMGDFEGIDKAYQWLAAYGDSEASIKNYQLLKAQKEDKDVLLPQPGGEASLESFSEVLKAHRLANPEVFFEYLTKSGRPIPPSRERRSSNTNEP